MYKVEGKILVKESQVKISNLQVVLYDLDNPPVDSVLQTYLKKFLCLDYEQQSTPTFWQQFPGNRLGSVLTDSDGGFKFEFDRKEFQGSDCEQSPDLILLVLAPEDTILDQTGIPRPLPPNERILHYSYETVIDSGKQESYIIRLPKELLDKFQIPYSIISSQPIKLTKESIEADLQESAKLRAGIKEAITEQARENALPAIALKRQTDEAFSNFTLSMVPEAIRSELTYLNPSDDLAKQQKLLLEKAIVEIPDIYDAGIERNLRLRLTQPQLEGLGLSVNEQNGTVIGDEVDGVTILNLLKKTTNVSKLAFVNPITTCKKQFEAERQLKEALENCKTKSTAANENTTSPPVVSDPNKGVLTKEFVHEHIARQMDSATAAEEKLTYDTTANIMTPSPADVTSYHDFHELQIAFDYIWQELFDDNLTLGLKKAYAEMIRYSNQVSGLPEEDEEATEYLKKNIGTVTDMIDLYSEIKLLQQIIEDQNSENDEVENAASVRVSPQRGARSGRTLFTEIERGLNLLQESSRGRPQSRGENVPVRVRAPGGAPHVTEPHNEPENQSPTPTPSRLKKMMEELDDRMSERFKFDIFAPNSINYGLMLTYRQAWEPKDYQVGDLVSTIPLAPKEVRRYSKKQIINKTRSQKELEDAQSSRKSESSSTSRAESEIIKRATNKTSFQQTAGGTVGVAGIAQGNFGTQFGIDAEKASSNTKKNFNEAVSKAAQEYKQQHRLEIETSTKEEFENVDSGEISNPNDEITVTYLFYELQRQYEVREQIHRLTPVILVANEVPKPHEIDEDWLIANHWILRRVILDDTYLPALDYVTTSIAGDEMSLEIMWTNLQRQANLVDELTAQFKNKSQLATDAFTELKRITGQINSPNDIDKLKDIGLGMIFGVFALPGLLDGDGGASEKREEMAKLTIERSDKDVKQANAKMVQEVTALQESIDKYTSALREHLDRQTAIAALRIHIKDNILCYMHRIWDHECSDQRFFRLHNIKVPWLEEGNNKFKVTSSQQNWQKQILSHSIPRANTHIIDVAMSLASARVAPDLKKLSQVADLDNLLGYKGNYMIFPVKEPNFMHLYMMQDYIDPDTKELRDPDEFANYTTEELIEYACCLEKKGVDNEFDETLQQLKDLIKERMAGSRKESEMIIVPTDSLYIEALPGKHPVLEDFKLTHRAIDVKKVQAEVRHDELENVRLAARLMNDEREDPDIEKKIVVENNDSDTIISTES